MGLKIVETKPTPPEIYNVKIYVTAIIIAAGAMLFGYCASFIGSTLTLPAFKNDFGMGQMTATEVSGVSANIISVFQAGAFFGALAGYPSMETVGRKWTLMGTTVLFLVGAVLQVAATHQIGMIYAGRVLAGLSVGVITAVCPVYLAELSPPSIRGRLIGFYEVGYQILAVIGFWLIYGIKKHMDPASSATWRVPFAIQFIPGGILLAGCFFLAESPRYLIKAGHPEKAAANLCWLRNLEPTHPYIEEELAATVIEINREREITFGLKGGKVARYFRGLWNEASAKGIRNRLVIGAFVMMWQNMSGINAINYYSPTLFASIGVEDTLLYTGIYGVLKAAASMVFFFLFVDSWGRRKPLIYGGIASGLCLLYVAVYIKVGHPDTAEVITASTQAGGKAAIAGIMLFSIFYCFGWNGLAWVICGEIYPTRIRGACAAWTAMWQWVFQFIIARETPAMSQNMGWGMFLMFAIFNFASVIFVIIWLPETKGRTLESMDELFGFNADDGPKPTKMEQSLVEDVSHVKAEKEKKAQVV